MVYLTQAYLSTFPTDVHVRGTSDPYE